MNQVSIKEVRVEALHDQFDVELELNQSLNVIYGKNGRGKTTLLHILANALEMDFQRFDHIQFRTIEIKTHQGDNVKITSANNKFDRPMIIEVNGKEMSPVTSSSGLSEAETSLARKALGERAVYLPAFRAILERTQGDIYSYQDRDRQQDLEKIRSSEMAIAKESMQLPALPIYDSRARAEQHQLTAYKTVQCRQWFGQFVPIIRYPSLNEVRGRLVEELREANYVVSNFEQRLFSELFTRVFKAVSGEEKAHSEKDTATLLAEVEQALKSIDATSANGYTNVYAEISEAVAHSGMAMSAEEETTKRILGLYSELLARRAAQHKESFSKIRSFERSVNLFLDGKQFNVEDGVLGHRLRGPSIVSQNGRKLNLSALSSGERQVVTMIFCASRLAANRGIFLVDEPELSLHVDWQRSILSEVMQQAAGRQVIACTHSPEVGADHYASIENFDPKFMSFDEDLFTDFENISDEL